MDREALLTAAFIHDLWLWYRITAARHKSQGLGGDEIDNEVEISDTEEEEEELEDCPVLAELQTTDEKVEHLKYMIKLVREIHFINARYN